MTDLLAMEAQREDPGPVLYCDECHTQLPDTKLKGVCAACLNKRYLGTMLKRERDTWAKIGFAEIELSRERGRLQHLVLKIDAGITYCGERATEGRKKRERKKLDALPPGLCTNCLRNFQELQFYVREFGERK